MSRFTKFAALLSLLSIGVCLTADASEGPIRRLFASHQAAPAPKVIPAPASTPPEAKSKIGPVGCVWLRAEMRRELMRQGKTRAEAIDLTSKMTDDMINGVSADAATLAKVQHNDVVGKLGDGTIFQAIMAWLKSPQGQAFIQALLQLLLHALGALGPAAWDTQYAMDLATQIDICWALLAV